MPGSTIIDISGWGPSFLVFTAVCSEHLHQTGNAGGAGSGCYCRSRCWNRQPLPFTQLVALGRSIRAAHAGDGKPTSHRYRTLRNYHGAYVPGVGTGYWIDPLPFVASVDPSLADDPHRLNREAFGLALKESKRRPLFHIVRMISSALSSLRNFDSYNYYWSLRRADVLPGNSHLLAEGFIARLSLFSRVTLLILHTMFLWALVIGFKMRSRTIGLVSLTIFLKVAIHAVLVAQARYFIPVIALEGFACGLAVEAVLKREFMRRSVITGLVATLLLLVLWFVQVRAEHYFLTQAEPPVSNPSSLDAPKGDEVLERALIRAQ